ncbi:MAG: hypothetical protein AB7W16_20455 [Candidatus Obscuribacterales bacterium]
MVTTFVALGLCWRYPVWQYIAWLLGSVLTATLAYKLLRFPLLSHVIAFMALASDIWLTGKYLLYAPGRYRDCVLAVIDLPLLGTIMLPAGMCLVSALIWISGYHCRKTCTLVLGVSLIAILALVRAYNLGEELRIAGIERVTKEYEPLVSAIKHYKVDKGKAPDTLEDLVPTYIARLPEQRRILSGASRGYGVDASGRWSLELRYCEGISQARLMYYQEGEWYPPTLRRINHWVSTLERISL